MTLFSYAFRPLFLFAVLHALLVVPYWALAWLGAVPLPNAFGNPIAWHAHEMIYGFAGAAIGGFALTAVATWTRRPPVAGRSLMLLSGLWLFARLLAWVPHPYVRVPMIVADVAYGLLLAALLAREIVAARNRRNYVVVLLIALLPLANLWFFVGATTDSVSTMAALTAGLWVVLLLVNLIAGRVIPAFTRNWLQRQHAGGPLPPPHERIDAVGTGLLVAFAAADAAGASAWLILPLGLATAAVLGVRLVRWRGARAVREPLVWVLHVAFAWLPIGVSLLVAASVGLVPRTAGVHALTSGAIATMILAIASRAALGHTGRPLEGHPLATSAYVLVTVAAVSRIAAAGGASSRPLLALSAAAWAAAFACFAWRYVPILIGPPQRRPGSLPTV